MNVTIHGEEHYLPVSTVTLYKEGNVTYPFHCVQCGNTSNIIGGSVTRISPVLEPSDQIPVISTCKSCKAKYVFQDSYESQPVVLIVLFPTPITQSFYCYLGGGDIKMGNKILEYNNKSVYSCSHKSTVSLPFTTICSNPECPLIYQFIKLN